MPNINKFLIIISVLFILFGCSHLESKYEQMTSEETADNYYIVWNERKYTCFGVIDYKDVGQQIGIVDNDKDNRIYEVKGYSNKEWLISYYYSGEMDSYMLFKEVNVKKIPEDLKKLKI